MKHVAIAVVSIFLIILSIVGAVFFSQRLISTKKVATSCVVTGLKHIITLESDRFEPAMPTAKLCDQIEFLNNAPQLRLITFGQYNKHLTYDGVTEDVLEQGKSFTITLNKPGTLLFHDHLQPTLHGSITISSK